MSLVVNSAFQNPVRTAAMIAVAYYTGQWIGDWMVAGAANAPTYYTRFATYSIEANVGTLSTIGSATVGAGSGFVVGAVAGGNVESGIRGAASGAILGAIDGYYPNPSSFERVAAKSFGGGVAARLQGGRFEDGFLSSGVSSGARYLYNSFVGYDVTAAPGENQPGNDPMRQVYDVDGEGRIFPRYQRWNIIGRNMEFGEPGSDILKQGGVLSRALNLIPGANAIAGMDDRANNYLNFLGHESLGNAQWSKVITIPLSVGATLPALMDRVPLYRPQDPFGRRR